MRLVEELRDEPPVADVFPAMTQCPWSQYKPSPQVVARKQKTASTAIQILRIPTLIYRTNSNQKLGTDHVVQKAIQGSVGNSHNRVADSITKHIARDIPKTFPCRRSEGNTSVINRAYFMILHRFQVHFSTSFTSVPRDWISASDGCLQLLC